MDSGDVVLGNRGGGGATTKIGGKQKGKIPLGLAHLSLFFLSVSFCWSISANQDKEREGEGGSNCRFGQFGGREKRRSNTTNVVGSTGTRKEEKEKEPIQYPLLLCRLPVHQCFPFPGVFLLPKNRNFPNGIRKILFWWRRIHSSPLNCSLCEMCHPVNERTHARCVVCCTLPVVGNVVSRYEDSLSVGNWHQRRERERDHKCRGHKSEARLCCANDAHKEGEREREGRGVGEVYSPNQTPLMDVSLLHHQPLLTRRRRHQRRESCLLHPPRKMSVAASPGGLFSSHQKSVQASQRSTFQSSPLLPPPPPSLFW